MKKIVIVTSVEQTLNAFFLNHLKLLKKKFSITLISNFNNNIREDLKEFRLININFSRKINFFSDIFNFFNLSYTIYKINPNLLLSVTPKIGLFCSVASFFLRVKSVHYFTGQVWITRKGFQRIFLKNIDRLMGFLSTHILTDSYSQKKFFEDERIIKKGKLKVLANGSICGVDTSQFKPNDIQKDKIRTDLGISKDSILLLFLGRLNKDKGVLDLAEVLNILNKKIGHEKKIHLLIIGPDEENIKYQVQFICKEYLQNIHFMDFTDEPEKFMVAADIFCLPSYREGFGMAALEAGACALPTVASRIYGLTDAVSENETGLFHAPGDIKGMETAITKLVKDKNLRVEMGNRGRERTKNLFEKSYVTKEFVEYIKSIN